MPREDLQVVLTAEQRQAGLYLEEDEDFLYLKREGQVLAVFSAVGTSIESIREEAERHIRE